jgi:hypothetical protein
MKKLFGKNKDEEHNFWMSYTDLMSGFLIIFIIGSLLAYKGYRDIFDGIGGGTPGEVKVKIEEYNEIKEIQSAMDSLNSKYYEYNVQFKRFECKKDIMFDPNSPTIPLTDCDDLMSAGNELVNILHKFNGSENVEFKIIIEGRAAQSHDNPMDSKNINMKILSYQRALSLYALWQKNGIIQKMNTANAEIFISGSGLEGKGRYQGFGTQGEDLNKRFIIQIVPYLKFNSKEKSDENKKP